MQFLLNNKYISRIIHAIHNLVPTGPGFRDIKDFLKKGQTKLSDLG